MNAKRSPEFRWLERGEGEPVVLLHGLMGEMDHWDATLDALAGASRVIAPALPIFDPALEEVSIAALARHVLQLLDAIDEPRAVIGGNSLGGHVALEVALAAPERVTGLVLTGSSGLFERTFTSHVPHVPTPAYVRARMQEVVYDAGLVTPAWVANIHRLVITRATAVRTIQFARAAKRSNLEARLGEIAVPTLLVWGQDDRITPPAVAERFHALIADSELVYLTRCGHAPMLERPEAFGDVVAEWLGETAYRRGAALPLGGAR